MGWNDKRFVLLIVSQDWKMSVPGEDQITRYFHPEEFCHSFTDTNTNAENIIHRLGPTQRPSHALNKCNNLKMQRDRFYYSVLLFCDGLVVLMWAPDNSVHRANSHSCFHWDSSSLRETCKKFRLWSTARPSFSSEPLYHSSDDTQYSSADFFKKLFCILEIVSMVTIVVGVF